MLVELSTTSHMLTAMATGSMQEMIMELDARGARADNDSRERAKMVERYLESARNAQLISVERFDCGVPYLEYRVSYDWALDPEIHTQQLMIITPLVAERESKNAAERLRIAPLVAAEKVKAELEKAERERIMTEKKAAKIQSRKETGNLTIAIERGSRDWGDPWIAKLTMKNGKKPDYDFSTGSYDGTTLSIPCAPGDRIAYGQKNYRKPGKTIHCVGRMNDEYEMIWD
jgi:hypothetical protein